MLDSLKAKGLVLGFTPEGRGHVVSHALYKPREIDLVLREKYRGGGAVQPPSDDRTGESADAGPTPAATAPSATSAIAQSLAEIRRELAELREQVDRLQGDVDQLRGTGTYAPGSE